MRYTFEDHYHDFKCIASKCPDSCCKGWEIIVDSDAYEKYKKNSSEFSKRIIKKITTNEDSEHVFIQKNGRCPFLNDKKLCDIIINEGENELCEVCRQHPRFVEEYGDITEISLSLSCPAVIDIIKNKTSLTFYSIKENDENAEYIIDDPLLPALLEIREKMLDIIARHDTYEAVSLIYSLALGFQNNIDADDFSDAAKLTPEYGEVKKFDYYGVLSSLEILTDEWREVLNSEKNKPNNIDKNDILLKNILSYFVYRYIPKSINDGDIISKAQFVIFSLGAIIHFAERNIFLSSQKDALAYTARLYSKEIEHNPDNIEKIMNKL